MRSNAGEDIEAGSGGKAPSYRQAAHSLRGSECAFATARATALVANRGRVFAAVEANCRRPIGVPRPDTVYLYGYASHRHASRIRRASLPVQLQLPAGCVASRGTGRARARGGLLGAGADRRMLAR